MATELSFVSRLCEIMHSFRLLQIAAELHNAGKGRGSFVNVVGSDIEGHQLPSLMHRGWCLDPLPNI